MLYYINNHSLNLQVLVSPDNYWFKRVICWLQSYLSEFFIKFLYCRALIIYECDYGLPVPRCILFLDYDYVAVVDIFVNHTVALHCECEQAGGCRHSVGWESNHLCPVLYCLNWLTSRNVSKKRNSNHASHATRIYTACLAMLFCYVAPVLQF